LELKLPLGALELRRPQCVVSDGSRRPFPWKKDVKKKDGFSFAPFHRLLFLFLLLLFLLLISSSGDTSTCSIAVLWYSGPLIFFLD
jgi:hypothetical protein